MSKAIAIGAAAVGGLLLWEWYKGGLTTSSVPATGTGTGTGTQPSTPTAPAAPQPTGVKQNVMPTAAQLVNIAGANHLNIYEWNYFYYQLTGRGINFDIAPFPVDGSTVVDVQTYLGYLTSMGLSGGKGMGHIIDLSSLFRGAPAGKGVGAREFAALGVIEDDPMNSAGYIDEGIFNEAAAFGGSRGDIGTKDFYLAATGQGS